MNKAIIAPVIALIALFAKKAFGYDLTQPELDIIVDGVLAFTALIGIFMEPNKSNKGTPE